MNESNLQRAIDIDQKIQGLALLYFDLCSKGLDTPEVTAALESYGLDLNRQKDDLYA